MQPSLYRAPHSPSRLSLTERIILGCAAVLLVVSIFGFGLDRRQRVHEQPVVGGTYTEGVIVDSPTKVERIMARLTNIGLTYRGEDGTIQPALAQSWDISGDNKTYTFHLRDGYSAASFLSTIQNSKNNWTGITITAPTDDTLQFVLAEPLGLFLGSTTAPLFPAGPYEVVKRDKQEVVLRANANFALGQPYLEKIVLRQFDSQEQLVKAAKDGEIDGSADFVDTPPRIFQSHEVNLPRYYVLFVNVSRPSLKKVADRQRITNAQDGPDVTYTLVTSQSSPTGDYADSLARELAAHHITLNVQKKNSLTLQKEDIPKREYDLLLYGIDFGLDRDYYPFWHSSQVSATGLNIAGIKDKSLDQLLESARKELDVTKREAVNKQIEDFLQQNAAQKVVGQDTFHFWTSKSVKGVKYATINDGYDRFNLVWQWYIRSKMVK